MMSVLGGLIGLGLGLLLVVLQLKFELIMFTPNLAYPVKIAIENILIVLLTISVLGALASLIASNRVRKII
jgi:lipoprotein-releasing system permease protein